MALLQLFAIALLLATANGASLLSDEDARNLVNPAALLKRCPCVPINTCYSQGVSLNEQDFLNTHFQCLDYTQNHCCGPYFPTLGSDDFYFDDAGGGEGGQGMLFVPGFSKTGEPVMIVMAQDATMEEEEEPDRSVTPGVVTVLPEVSPASTTIEPTTTEEGDSSTTVEAETTTEAITDEPTTTTTTTNIVTTTTAKPKLRLPKNYSRRVLPRFERKSTSTTEASSTTSPNSSTTSTTTAQNAETETVRKLPTRRTQYRSEFRQRLISARVRSTTASSHLA